MLDFVLLCQQIKKLYSTDELCPTNIPNVYQCYKMFNFNSKEYFPELIIRIFNTNKNSIQEIILMLKNIFLN